MGNGEPSVMTILTIMQPVQFASNLVTTAIVHTTVKFSK